MGAGDREVLLTRVGLLRGFGITTVRGGSDGEVITGPAFAAFRETFIWT